jgi:hypothetical protein
MIGLEEKRKHEQTPAERDAEERARAALVKQHTTPDAIRSGVVRGWDGARAMAEWEVHLPALPEDVEHNELVHQALEVFSLTMKLALHEDHRNGIVSVN